MKTLWDRIVLCRSSNQELEKFVKEYNDKHKRKKDVVINTEKSELLFVDSETSDDIESTKKKVNKKEEKKSVLFPDSDSDSD